MAHTKGPWIKATTNVYSEDNRLCIMIQPARSYQEIGIKELEANARLIASAPELLEACKEALDALQAQGIYEDRQEQLKQAIAKAEGKE